MNRSFFTVFFGILVLVVIGSSIDFSYGMSSIIFEGIIHNPTPEPGDNFGQSVSIYGSFGLIGAPGDNTGADNAGSAYLLDPYTMTLTETINNPSPEPDDIFGNVVYSHLGSGIIGAEMDDTDSPDSGQAYLYNLATSGAPLITTIANPDSSASDIFGAAIAKKGSNYAIGVPQNDLYFPDSGIAYFYYSNPTTVRHTLENPSPEAGDMFGSAVGVGDYFAVVGAKGHDGPEGHDIGEAYYFSSGGSLKTTFSNPNPVAYDYFGSFITERDYQILITAPGGFDSTPQPGTAYLYDVLGNLLLTIDNPDPSPEDRFGVSAALRNDIIVIGAPGDDTAGLNSGSVYIFDKEGNLLETISNPNPSENSFFGNSISLHMDKLIIGTPGDDMDAENAGVAYVYTIPLKQCETTHLWEINDQCFGGPFNEKERTYREIFYQIFSPTNSELIAVDVDIEKASLEPKENSYWIRIYEVVLKDGVEGDGAEIASFGGKTPFEGGRYTLHAHFDSPIILDTTKKYALSMGIANGAYDYGYWLKSNIPSAPDVYPEGKAVKRVGGGYYPTVFQSVGGDFGFATYYNDPNAPPNSPPVLNSVSLSEDSITYLDKVTCIPGPVTDADRDDISFEYSWLVNGIESNYHSDTFTNYNSRGNVIECVVTPFDGEDYGAPIHSEQLVVQNYPPFVSSGSVGVFPGLANTMSVLSCQGDATDIDGDPISIKYEWFVNGVQTSTEKYLYPSEFNANDEISCHFTPNDGFVDGKTYVPYYLVTIIDDADNDGILNDADNCEFIVNIDQADQDQNGIGDVCDGLFIDQYFNELPENMQFTTESFTQSFTPSARSISAIDLYLAGFTRPYTQIENLEITLFEGDVNGVSLTTKVVSVVIPLHAPGSPIHIDFGNTIPVVPGQLYTIQVNNPGWQTDRTFVYAQPDNYSSGSGSVPNYTGEIDFGFVTYYAESNEPPNADANGPYLTQINTALMLDASGSSDPDGLSDIATYKWDLDGDGEFDDGFGISPTVQFDTAGVRAIGLKVTDLAGATSTTTTMVVVYDPEGGFVSGGGWIISPEGSCNIVAIADVCNYDVTGKATFGFVSKYQKGATEPSGDTQFYFKAGNLKFKSSDYEWLTIVIAGAKAQYKGTGTINGEGDYGFILTAFDADYNNNDNHTQDKFRIKIWDRTNDDEIVYDNKMGESDDYEDATAIGGGSIQIHKPK